MSFQKTPPIKAPKLTKSAQGQPCYLRVPGVCRGRTETVVPCHSPFSEDNQGVGQKAHDFFAVPGCMECHDWLDSRTHKDVGREWKWEIFHRALKKWWEHLWRDGVIGVKNKS